MATIKELKEFLAGRDDSEVIAFDIWQVGDIKTYAEDRGISLSDFQCGAILSSMHFNRDAIEGLNWEVVDYYVSKYTPRSVGGVQ